jgi:WD40 repeat protein
VRYVDIATSLAISPNGRWLALGEARAVGKIAVRRAFEITLWDLQSGKRVDTLTGPLAKVTMLTFAGNDLLVSSGDDQVVRWWSTRSLGD